MTDEELVKRLRNAKATQDFRHTLEDEAADRIEALTAEVAAHKGNADTNYSKWVEADAKLAKVVELALEECPFREGTGSYNDWWHDRRATLAAVAEPHKIKGESHDGK